MTLALVRTSLFFRRVRKRSLIDLIILLVPWMSIEFRTNKPSDIISTLVSMYIRFKRPLREGTPGASGAEIADDYER